MPADVLAGFLHGTHEIPATVDQRTRTLMAQIRDALSSRERPEMSAVDTLSIAVDADISDLVSQEAMAALFVMPGLEPRFVKSEEVLSLPGGPDHALVTVTSSFDVARFFAWEAFARDQGLSWAPFHLTENGAAYGPYVEPLADSGARMPPIPSPGPRDLVARWITASPEPDHVRARLNSPVARLSRVAAHEVLPALADFAADVQDWLLGRDADGLWHHVVLSGERTRHPVLPVPEASHPAHEVTAEPQPTLTPASVLDPVTGIVVRLRPIELSDTFPRGAVYTESQTADMGRIRPWAANIYNAGSAWDDEDAARQGAVGEAIERYCGNVYRPEHLRRCSYQELRDQGERAVDPTELALFSADQYAQAGMPFLPFTPDLEVSWVPGRSLASGQLTWVPASLVYVNWNSGDSIMDPPVNPAYYPGIAAAPSREAALCNALEEVIERDTAMIWWLSGGTAPVLPEPEFLAARTTSGSPVRTHFLFLPNRFSVPVIGAAVEDVTDGLCTLGLACRHTPDLAARKALLEGLGLVESARDMQRPDGGFWSAFVEAGSPTQPIKPIRTDRCYLDDYRPDFRDATDLFCQLQVQLDPRARDVTAERWAAAEAPIREWERMESLPERSSAAYVEAIAREGFDPICVELTTSDVRAAGWTAVRVVVPGLVPNFPTAFPPLGTGRVLTEASRLGLRERQLREDEVFSFPMPYA